MTTRARALVIGGSVGGLFASHLLRRSGWDVAVFERSADDLTGRGAGIGLTEPLLSVFQRIEIPPSALGGITTRSGVWLDRSGEIRAEVPSGIQVTSWSRLYRALKNALPVECYRANMPLDHVEPQQTSVTAVFADGSHATGDLLVAADGIHSTVRSQFLPEVTPRYAGYVTWRGIVGEAEAPPGVRDWLFNRLAFCFPEGELLLAMPNPSSDADANRRFYWVWYRPADYGRDLPQLCTDASGHQHGLSIPPYLIRREIIDDLKECAEHIFAPSIAALIRSTRQPMLLPVFDLESPGMEFGRVVLLGDAAFVARPHVVAGVTKAALDAQALADSLADPIAPEKALTRYEAAQRELGRKLVDRGRRLGAYLEAQLKLLEQRSEEELHWQPERILREYGAGDLIRQAARE